jgi:hypothetical protein
MPRRPLLDRRLEISESLRIELKAYEILDNPRYPEGVKARFVLLDLCAKKPLLLIDNHAPYGFHLHDSRKGEERQILETSSYLDALELFWALERVTKWGS